MQKPSWKVSCKYRREVQNLPPHPKGIVISVSRATRRNQRITPLFDFWKNFWYNFYVKVIRGSFLYSKIKMRDSTCGCPPIFMSFLSPPRVHLYSCAIGFHLSQRGEIVVILCQVRVEDRTIMFRHGKGAMPQEFL